MASHTMFLQAGQIVGPSHVPRRQRNLPLCSVFSQQQAYPRDEWRGGPPGGQQYFPNGRSSTAWQPPGRPTLPPTIIRLAGTSTTSMEARLVIATRMHSYELGVPISPEDQALLLEVLQFHPNAAEKRGCGVSHMSVQNTSHGTKCFWVHRTDGTYTDFSYIKCLQNMDTMYSQGLVDEDGRPTAPIPAFRPPNSPRTPVYANSLQQGYNSTAEAPWERQQSYGHDSWQQPGQRQQYQQPQRQAWGQWPPPPEEWGGQVEGMFSSAASASSSSGSDTDWFASFDSESTPMAAPSNPSTQTPSNTAQQPVQQPPHTAGSTTGAGIQGHPQQPPHPQGADREWTWRDCLLAMQATVAPQLKEYKKLMLATPAAQRQVLLCAITGEVLTPVTSCVRYDPPQTLKDLALDWMKGRRMRSKRELQVGYVPGQRGPVMLNPDQAVSWAEYHRVTARVQLVSRNASQTSKQGLTQHAAGPQQQ